MGGFERTGHLRNSTAAIPPKPVPDVSQTLLGAGEGKPTREQSRSMGYTGDQCSHCQSMRMQIAGHCLVCAECGTTTGCS